MIQNLRAIYPYYIFLSIFIISLSLILFFNTRKYKDKKSNFYSLFLNLNARNVILLASTLLNFTFVFFLACFIKYYHPLIIYMLIINSIISIIICFDIQIIGYDIMYTIASVVMLKIFNLIYTYLSNIYYERIIFILGILFLIMIIVYSIFITIRKMEMIVNKSRYIRRVSNEQ